MAKKKKHSQESQQVRPLDPILRAHESMGKSAVAPDQLQTFVRLVGLAGQMQQVCDDYLRAFGLSTARLALLLVLIETPQEPQCPSYLAGRLGVTRATVTGLVAALDKLGLVDRKPDPHDGRKSVVGVGLRARQVVQQILPGYFDCIAGVMQKVEKKRLSRLDKTLSIIEHNATGDS